MYLCMSVLMYECMYVLNIYEFACLPVTVCMYACMSKQYLCMYVYIYMYE